MRILTTIITALLVLGACGGDEPDAGCERWERVRQEQISDDAAVEELNTIADRTENPYVRNRALDLAILLEGDSTQTEVRRGFEDLDAACA